MRLPHLSQEWAWFLSVVVICATVIVIGLLV